MKVVSLFSGAGGLDLGFVKAGAKIIWANDIDKDSVTTYIKNIDKSITLGDIRKIDKSNIPECDVLIGGFPCLGYTIAKGKDRTINDPHNLLYLEYLEVLKKIKPTAFLIENVAGILQGKEFQITFEKMLREFYNAGYYHKYKILHSADYGVPQKRKRVVIIGSRKDKKISINFPKTTHEKSNNDSFIISNLANWITLREAIGDLRELFSKEDSEHVGSKHVVKINGYVGNRKLDWDKPAPTITGRGSRTGGPVIHPHPNLKRRLSIKECKRIQSFPDDFIFHGSISSAYAQIGNAVPPLLSFRIAQEFLIAFKEKPKKFEMNEWGLPWKEKIPQIQI